MSIPKRTLYLSTTILVLSTTLATPPPGYVKKQDNDKDPPRYAYGYDVRDGKGSRQGHLESRDGEHALGLYYVKLPSGSGTSVHYFADDWGYHPLVSYSSSTKTSSTKAQFALGEKAVAALNKEPQPTIDSLPAAGPSTAAVANSLDKTATPAGTAVLPEDTDILKVRGPGTSAPAGTRQEETQLNDTTQKDVSAVNNLIDSKEEVEYSVVTNATQSTTPTPQLYGKTEEENSETSSNDFSENNGLHAASYKIIDIGGAGNFYSESPSYLPLVSETASGGFESESSSILFGGHYSHVNPDALSIQGDGNFGERIRQKIASSSSSAASYFSSQGQQHVSGENSQYKDFGEEQPDSYVTSTPVPQSLQPHPIRPIVVAEIYSKEIQKEETVTQNQEVFESSTRAPDFISSFPEPSSNALLEGSTAGEASPYSSSPSAPSSSIYAISNGQSGNIYHLPQVSPPTAHEEQYISVTSDGQIGVPLVEHTTPNALAFTSQDTSKGYYPDEQISEAHSKEEQSSAYAEITASRTIGADTTPASPILVTYLQGESGPGGKHYSSSNTSAQNGIYVTSTPTGVSDYLGFSDSSNAGDGGSNLAHYSTPLSIFISQSHKTFSEQESSAIITSNNGQSGHIVPGTGGSYSSSTTTTTPRPDENNFDSHFEDGNGASTTASYLIDATPTSEVIISTPQPIAAPLTSSAEILAPLQAGVSLSTSNSNEKVKEEKSLSVLSSNNYQKLPLPQVKEEVDDLPAPKTTVEIQRSIPLDFNKLKTEALKLGTETEEINRAQFTSSANQAYLHSLISKSLDFTTLKEQALRLGAENEKINRAQFISPSNQFYQINEVLKSQKEDSVAHKQAQQQENQNVQAGNAVKYVNVEPTPQSSPIEHLQVDTQTISHYPLNQHILAVQQLTNTEQRGNLEQVHVGQYSLNQNNRLLEAQNQQQFDAENKELFNMYNNQPQKIESAAEHLHRDTTEFQTNSGGLSSLESEFSQHNVYDSGLEHTQSQFIDGNAKHYNLNGVQEAMVQSSVKQTVPIFNKRPGELERQLQSEYNQQLTEEQKQEDIKLEELSKVHAEEQQTPQVDAAPLSTPVQPNVPVEQTHINVHVVEKAVAFPITKLLPVERPVPFAHPVAVPVPFAIPHPLGVPVPHILPYPQLLSLPINEIHPVYFQGKQHPDLGSTSTIHYHVQHFPSRTPIPVILKALQYGGGRYGDPVSFKQNAIFHQLHHHHRPQQQHHLQGQSVAESNRVSHVLQLLPPPPPQKSQDRRRPSQKARRQEFLKNLCIEYGFKPPLVPSVQIDDDTKFSFAPPPQKE